MVPAFLRLDVVGIKVTDGDVPKSLAGLSVSTMIFYPFLLWCKQHFNKAFF